MAGLTRPLGPKLVHVTLDSDTIQWRLLLEGPADPDSELSEDEPWVDAFLTVVTGRGGGVRAEIGVDVDALELRRFSDDVHRCVSGGAVSASIGNDLDDFSLSIEAGEHAGAAQDTWLVSGHVGWETSSIVRFSGCAVDHVHVHAFARSLQRALRSLS